MFRTPKRQKGGSKLKEIAALTSDRILKPRILNSIDKDACNGNSSNEIAAVSPNENRRGRPRADCLNALILEGSTSPSSIKCTYCGRVFPREKSLQAHLRTHTGEKPYLCDYPRCCRRFAQSGQLKTHQRLHTGEKPFTCSAPNCDQRFTHANRRCQLHPDLQLKRFNSSTKTDDISMDENHHAQVLAWLSDKEKRMKRSSSSSSGDLDTTPKRTRILTTRDNSPETPNICDSTQNSHQKEFENTPPSSADGLSARLTDNEELFCAKEMPDPTWDEKRLPKKRWLREATRRTEIAFPPVPEEHESNQEELAKPLDWDDSTDNTDNNNEYSCPAESLIMMENQNRPSVLVRLQDGQKKTITNDEIQTAIALVELKNGDGYKKCNYRI